MINVSQTCSLTVVFDVYLDGVSDEGQRWRSWDLLYESDESRTPVVVDQRQYQYQGKQKQGAEAERNPRDEGPQHQRHGESRKDEVTNTARGLRRCLYTYLTWCVTWERTTAISITLQVVSHTRTRTGNLQTSFLAIAEIHPSQL